MIIAGAEAPVHEVRTLREADWAYCPTCDTVITCQYWGPKQSRAMHQRGTGHRVILIALS